MHMVLVSKYFKDSHGSTIGKLVIFGDGKQELYDHRGAYLGAYKPVFNTTVNRLGQTVGSGNILAMLLRQ